MTSCFEVAMALTEEGYVSSDDLDDATTVLVQTLLATGVIKERSRAVEEKEIEEEIYTSATYTAAAQEARANFEEEIRQAEIMIEAQERKLSNEKIIVAADEVIAESARLAAETLVEKGLVDSGDSEDVRKLVAELWASTSS